MDEYGFYCQYILDTKTGEYTIKAIVQEDLLTSIDGFRLLSDGATFVTVHGEGINEKTADEIREEVLMGLLAFRKDFFSNREEGEEGEDQVDEGWINDLPC